MNEVAEFHRLSGRAFLAMMGEGPGREAWLTYGSALCLSGENAADFNMLFVGSSEAESFLPAAMARVEDRELPLLALIAPDIAEAVAPVVEQRGFTAAGAIPLMVLRSAPTLRPGADIRVEEATTPEQARVAGDLIAAAFKLPRDAVARTFEATIGSASEAKTYLAYDQDIPVSSVTVTPAGATAGIWSMATPPERQGKGMGRALLGAVIDHLRVKGVERFYLYATAAGFPLYRSLGFETLTEETAWVKGHSTQAHA